MAVPLPTVNDIFFTHLHVDRYADISTRSRRGWALETTVCTGVGRTAQDGIAT
jgi:hypothetical protein